MRICVLSCFQDLTQKNTGGAVRVYYLSNSLAKLGHKVHIVIPGDQENFTVNGMKIHGVKGLFPTSVLEFLRNLVGSLSLSPFFFYDFVFILKVCRRMIKSDIIQIEQPWAGALIVPLVTRIFRKPLIVDSHDVFQAIRLRHTGLLRRFLETSLETLTYKLSSMILVVSERDRKLLVDQGINKDKIMIIPNGVDTEKFVPASMKPNNDDNRKVIFVGNMHYSPNQEAVQLIASRIVPRVQNKIGKVEFLIVGRTPQGFQSSLKNLTFLGVVEDVAECLNISDVAIAPLFHGSGTRLKLLEYFACGLPVVSTSVGAEGLDVKDGENILIEDDLDEFAAKVILLLQDRAFSAKLGKAARSLVVSKYDWREISKKLSEVYQRMLQRDAD